MRSDSSSFLSRLGHSREFRDANPSNRRCSDTVVTRETILPFQAIPSNAIVECWAFGSG